MKIYVDADGCPVINEAIKIAKDYKISIIIVKNYAHEISDDYAKVITVDISTDSADFYIVNQLEKGDIVITQDYGLAAMSLSKNAIPLNQNGFMYSNDNIDGMLGQRHINRILRQQGKYYPKTKKRKSDLDITFSSSLNDLINKNLNTEKDRPMDK